MDSATLQENNINGVLLLHATDCSQACTYVQDANSFKPSAFLLAIVKIGNLTRHHDRVVLIGLCWLYGHSPPRPRSPPPPQNSKLGECPEMDCFWNLQWVQLVQQVMRHINLS